jgi:hypothetical protein
VNQRFEATANVGDADAVTANEEIAASWNISLENWGPQQLWDFSCSFGF